MSLNGNLNKSQFMEELQQKVEHINNVLEKFLPAEEGLADINKRHCPFAPFPVIINASDSGCAILLKRPLSRFLCNSCTIAAMVIPSNAILFLL